MIEPEPEPGYAADLVGPGVDRARSFAADLATHGERLGLIGPQELPRLWSRHIVNSALLAPLLRGRVADVGSGAGLPGLVLAMARPDLRLVLIEPMERRTVWLRDEADRLGLHNVEVIRARAQDAPRGAFDQVTARAVGALRTLIPLTAPLVGPGGELLLLKGARATVELEAAAREIRRARLRDARIEELGLGTGAAATRVFRATVD